MKTRSYLVSGAGSGIGRAIAQEISGKDLNSSLILLGRNKDSLEKVRKELHNPDAHTVLIADLRNPEQIQEAIQGAHLKDKNLVALIANAGIGGENHYGTQDRWDEIIATNLSGTYHLIQECLPALRRSNETYRHIVMISSVLARLGVPKYSAYCASKAGLLGLMRSLASELAPEKILVNAICPGWVDTKMSEEGLIDIAKSLQKPVDLVKRTEMNRIPLGRMSDPKEVAALVQFLTSGTQTSITGQTLDINGGAVMA